MISLFGFIKLAELHKNIQTFYGDDIPGTRLDKASNPMDIRVLWLNSTSSCSKSLRSSCSIRRPYFPGSPHIFSNFIEIKVLSACPERTAYARRIFIESLW
jgi:hypothetical protein